MEYIVIAAIVVWLAFRVSRENRRANDVSQRLEKLEREMSQLLREREAPRPSPKPAAAVTEPAPPPLQPLPRPVRPEVTVPIVKPPAEQEPARLFEPPALSRPAINWEQFMGVKLFAWIGGLALFFGVAFF